MGPPRGNGQGRRRRGLTHRKELEAPLQPLERVDPHPHLPSGLPPLWNRSWKQGAAVAAWFAANPVIFPAPEDDSSWATRGVLGEELWTAKRRRDIPMALNAASAVYFAGAILSAYRRRLWPMMVCAGPSLLLKLWFIDRMTFYYEEHKEREEPAKEEAEAASTPSSK